MRFENYLTEFARERYGHGITFVDIDETIFRTFAKILVRSVQTGEVLRQLSNQEFNAYKLQPGEEFDFHQFRDAKFFKETSIPIPQTVARINKMLAQIQEKSTQSKIVFLTARADFDDKHTVIDAFKEVGIKIKQPLTYIERTGNDKIGTVAEKKKRVVLKYLATGLYRRCRLIDDDMHNLKLFMEVEKELPKSTEDKVIEKYNLDMTKEKLPPISFYALLVKPDGVLQRVMDETQNLSK